MNEGCLRPLQHTVSGYPLQHTVSGYPLQHTVSGYIRTTTLEGMKRRVIVLVGFEPTLASSLRFTAKPRRLHMNLKLPTMYFSRVDLHQGAIPQITEIALIQYIFS